MDTSEYTQPEEIANERHREILRLYYQGWTHAAIARELGYDSARGHKIVYRVLYRLRKQGHRIPKRNTYA